MSAFEFMWVAIAMFFFSIPMTLGIYEMYKMYRFVRRRGKGFVDQTAGALALLMTEWALCSQPEIVAKRLPFVTEDLTEWMELRDDGEIT